MSRILLMIFVLRTLGDTMENNIILHIGNSNITGNLKNTSKYWKRLKYLRFKSGNQTVITYFGSSSDNDL